MREEERLLLGGRGIAARDRIALLRVCVLFRRCSRLITCLHAKKSGMGGQVVKVTRRVLDIVIGHNHQRTRGRERSVL